MWRQQVKWVVFAGAVMVALTVASEFVSAAGTLLGLLAVPLVPAAIGVAMLRHHLYDVDVLINRSPVYASLTACLAGAYVAVVAVLGAAVLQRRWQLVAKSGWYDYFDHANAAGPLQDPPSVIARHAEM